MKINNPPFSGTRNWRYYIDLVVQEAKAGLRVEISRGYLGVMWWVIEPLIYMAAFYIIFAHLLHRGNDNFIIFLLTGLIAWKWFATTIMSGSNSLIANANLMNQVYLPKIIFPLTIIAINTFKFLIIFIIFLICLQFTPIKASLIWAMLPVVILTQLMLIVSVVCLISAIMPFFPDLRFVLDNILMLLLFLSGIFFDISKMPEPIKKYLALNPIGAVISMYRKVLLYGLTPDWQQLLLVMLFSVVVFLMALLLLHRFDRIYPKLIN